MHKLLFIASCLFLAGCVTNPVISPTTRTENVSKLATKANWKSYTISTNIFTLKAFGPHVNNNIKTLTIYIEGDGLAWLSRDMPSQNPTPIVPLAFQMALHDHKNFPAVYLARPCQYVFNQAWKNCREAYWTNLRFSPEVIAAMNQAVTILKKKYHAQKIQLIGYSGGGAIATLIAARRTDVIKLITVAGILDTTAWTNQQQLSPLTGSLNPADEWKKLVFLPQTHWIGGDDKIVPETIAIAYANHFPSAEKPTIKVIPSFTHACCWATEWTP